MRGDKDIIKLYNTTTHTFCRFYVSFHEKESTTYTHTQRQEFSIWGKYRSYRTFLLPFSVSARVCGKCSKMIFFVKVKDLAIHHHHFENCHWPHPGATPSNLRGGSKKSSKFKVLRLTWNLSWTKGRVCSFQNVCISTPPLLPTTWPFDVADRAYLANE